MGLPLLTIVPQGQSSPFLANPASTNAGNLLALVKAEKGNFFLFERS
jgi:hypothetical protein